MLHYNVQVDLRCPFLVFGMKKNDFTAAFMNGIADGKPWFYAINKPNGFAMVTCITYISLLYSDFNKCAFNTTRNVWVHSSINLKHILHDKWYVDGFAGVANQCCCKS